MPEQDSTPTSIRARCEASLLDCFPEQTEAIARGWELVDLFADNLHPIPTDSIRRFLHQKIAIIGDSYPTIRFHPRDADLAIYPIYFRIAVYPGEPPAHPQCVHYEACALGTVHDILAEYGQVALVVQPEHYIINQTF